MLGHFPCGIVYIFIYAVTNLHLQDAEDDDGLDLFGDETEDNKKAAERAAAKPAKKKESELCYVLKFPAEC